jgi:CBS domain containing-hemolysin-like protein
VEPKSELASTYTPDELAQLISESAAEGLLDRTEQQRLNRALRLDQRTARTVTIPLDDAVTLRPDSTVRDLEECVAGTGYSRFPVRVTAPSGEAGLTGYVHAKDLLDLDAADYDAPIPAKLIRPMVSIDADLPLTRTFAVLERAGRHIGAVTADGVTLGLVTLEDVLEELVGEIQDATHHPGPADPPATRP